MIVEIPKLLNASELDEIRSTVQQGAWQAGDVTAGDRAKSVKNNQEMSVDCEFWQKTNNAIVSRLYENALFQRACLPARVSAGYIVRYGPGMTYGSHVDDPVMGAGKRYRSDIAVTVFLSAPDEYEGGELHIDETGSEQLIKLPAGDAVCYPASTVHSVETVTAGERLVCILWVQSLVRNTEQRKILLDLDEARQALHVSVPAARVTMTLDKVYSNLVRMWADP